MATQKLASVAAQARKLIDPLYATLRRETISSYEQMMAANKQYVVTDPVAAERLAKSWFYTKLSQVPGGIKASEAELGVLRGKLKSWKELSAQEMGVLCLFGGELFCWCVLDSTLNSTDVRPLIARPDSLTRATRFARSPGGLSGRLSGGEGALRGMISRCKFDEEERERQMGGCPHPIYHLPS